MSWMCFRWFSRSTKAYEPPLNHIKITIWSGDFCPTTFSKSTSCLAGGNSKIFYFHPENCGRWTHFDFLFFKGVGSTTNQLCCPSFFLFFRNFSRLLWGTRASVWQSPYEIPWRWWLGVSFTLDIQTPPVKVFGPQKAYLKTPSQKVFGCISPFWIQQNLNG